MSAQRGFSFDPRRGMPGGPSFCPACGDSTCWCGIRRIAEAIGVPIQRANASGPDGRSCPRCHRDRALLGKRDGDRPRLTCRGCGERFELEWGSAGNPDQLIYVELPPPARGYTAIQDRVA